MRTIRQLRAVRRECECACKLLVWRHELLNACDNLTWTPTRLRGELRPCRTSNRTSSRFTTWVSPSVSQRAPRGCEDAPCC